MPGLSMPHAEGCSVRNGRTTSTSTSPNCPTKQLSPVGPRQVGIGLSKFLAAFEFTEVRLTAH